MTQTDPKSKIQQSTLNSVVRHDIQMHVKEVYEEQREPMELPSHNRSVDTPCLNPIYCIYLFNERQ